MKDVKGGEAMYWIANFTRQCSSTFNFVVFGCTTQNITSLVLWCSLMFFVFLYSLQTDCCRCYPPSWVHWNLYLVVVRLKLWLQIMVLARGLGRERVLEYAGICWNTLGYFHVGTMACTFFIPSNPSHFWLRTVVLFRHESLTRAQRTRRI